jgi:hypothetical protein
VALPRLAPSGIEFHHCFQHHLVSHRAALNSAALFGFRVTLPTS